MKGDDPKDCYRDGKPIGYSDGHDAGCDGPFLTETPCPVCGAYLISQETL